MKMNISTVLGARRSHAGVQPFIRKRGPSSRSALARTFDKLWIFLHMSLVTALSIIFFTTSFAFCFFCSFFARPASETLRKTEKTYLRLPVDSSSGALQAAFQDVGGGAHGRGDSAGGEGGEDVGWRVVGEAQEWRGEKVGLGGGVAVRAERRLG